MAEPVSVVVRLLPGVVGEMKRTSHLVPVDVDTGIPDTVRAYCGLEIEQGTAEVLTTYAGMPCTLCMLRSPSAPAEIEP